MSKTKNCVISAVGKNSLHRSWMEGDGEANFDLHLIVYDDSIEQFRKDTDYICYIKGYKLKVIYKYLQTHPQLKGQYEYFFFPDDDIQMNADTINRLFDAMRYYRLKIAQPALAMSYFTWGHTLKDRYCKLRYTDFIEMMVPCFERGALERVLFTFNENETGWGTEVHWPLLIQAAPQEMAVIDEICVVHTRPIQSGQEIHKRELAEYLQKHNLTLKVCNYNHIPADRIYCCDRRSFLQLCHTLEHWIKEEGIIAKSIGLDGCFGYVHLLSLLAGMTQNRNYADSAYKLLERVQEGLAAIKDDMAYKSGITGCCWLIEYLAQTGFIEDNPEEILEEIYSYITRYQMTRYKDMSFAELAGIGQCYLIRRKNRPSKHNLNACKEIASLLSAKIAEGNASDDIDVMTDVLMLLQECGMLQSSQVKDLEMKINHTPAIQTERVYRLFRLYQLTQESYLLTRVQEGMKNLTPQLLTLEDARMLSEIMFYTVKE